MAGSYKLPSEDTPHERTFMQWPIVTSIYGGRAYLEETQGAIIRLANQISEFEPVVMLAARDQQSAIASQFSEAIELWDVATEDLWCRDSGPCFVLDADNNPIIMNFNFNGWGDKQRHLFDGKVAERVAEILDLPVRDSGVVGEPGGFEYDGAGVLIAHESSWVNKNRSLEPRDAIEARLRNATGAKKIIWAPGLAGEDITDYHIDALARFTAPGKILIQHDGTIDPVDLFTIAAQETFEILRDAVDAEGKSFEITALAEPKKVRSRNADFVASYANYYVCNGAVIAAQFGDTGADEAAAITLKSHYPDREIVLLNVDPIGEAGGGIHCATREQPEI